MYKAALLTVVFVPFGLETSDRTSDRSKPVKCSSPRRGRKNCFPSYFLFDHIINNLLTELGRSVWENLDLDRWYRPNAVRSVLATSVKILPYRPPARLIRTKYCSSFNSPVLLCVIHSFLVLVFYSPFLRLEFLMFLRKRKVSWPFASAKKAKTAKEPSGKEPTTVSRFEGFAAGDRGSYYEQEKWIVELQVEESRSFKYKSSCHCRSLDLRFRSSAKNGERRRLSGYKLSWNNKNTSGSFVT